jgi:hypothetical protein
LKEFKVPFFFRCLAMHDNLNEMDKMKKLAEKFHAPLSIGTNLVCKNERMALGREEIDFLKFRYPELGKNLNFEYQARNRKCKGILYFSSDGELKFCPELDPIVFAVNSLNNKSLISLLEKMYEDKISLACPLARE